MTSETTITLDQLGLGPAGRLLTDHVVMGEPEARGLAGRLWSIDADPIRMATEKDDTFWLRCADGARYVLKISNPNEDPDEVEFETELLRYVGERAGSVPISRLVPTPDGRILVPLRDGAGQHRLARMMTYLPGTPLDSTDSSPAERERVGEILAQLRHATAGFSHRAENRLCAWNIEHLPALWPLRAAVEDDEHRRLLAEGFARFSRLALPELPGLRRQVLHNDFSRSNILVDHDAPEFVTGIIDFGDAVTTAIVIDVSTALLNQLPRTVTDGDLFDAGRDILRGYLRFADLTDSELALLPHLVMGRVIARALISVHRAAVIPANAGYVLRNTEQGWAQLRWFLDRDPGAITASFL